MRFSILYQIVALAATTMTVIAEGPFDLSWNTIDGGGAIRTTGGDFELSGTIGQLDAGVMTGGDFKLTGGIWFETPPGDCNIDGVVGLMDHRAFVSCLDGPVNEIEPGCECFDVNSSGTIDLADFSKYQGGFFGE